MGRKIYRESGGVTARERMQRFFEISSVFIKLIAVHFNSSTCCSGRKVKPILRMDVNLFYNGRIVAFVTRARPQSKFTYLTRYCNSGQPF